MGIIMVLNENTVKNFGMHHVYYDKTVEGFLIRDVVNPKKVLGIVVVSIITKEMKIIEYYDNIEIISKLIKLGVEKLNAKSIKVERNNNMIIDEAIKNNFYINNEIEENTHYVYLKK